LEPKNRKGVIRDILSLIIASRKGLSESEILGILGLHYHEWSPIFIALEESLVTRSGLLTFFHDYLRQAVEARYVNTFDQIAVYRHKLLHYFLNHHDKQRKFEEVPYQHEKLCQFKQLLDFCLNPENFQVLSSETFKFDLFHYWRLFPKELHPETKLVDQLSTLIVSAQIGKAEECAKTIDPAAFFLKEVGCYSTAEKLFRCAENFAFFFFES